MRAEALRKPLLTLALCVGLGMPAVARAQTIRVLVQSSPLAGFQYHQGPALWDQLREGDALELTPEPGNPHDSRAVQVRWRGHMLGYLPRLENRSAAAEFARGGRLVGRIARLTPARNPWARLRVDVYLEL